MNNLLFPKTPFNAHNANKTSNSVLIIGGGSAGTISALYIAQLGYKVYLITEESSLYSKTKPQTKDEDQHLCHHSNSAVFNCINPCNCYDEKVNQVVQHPNIEVIYNGHLVGFSGQKGNFCADILSVKGHRELTVGAVVLSLGYDTFAPVKRGEYGYGYYKNVITSLELEEHARWDLLSGGKILRPSDGKEPKRVAFIQCVGSRDCHRGADYCSSVCCMYSLKEAMFLKEQFPKLEITIFYLDMRTHGKSFEEYLAKAKEMGINFVRTMVSTIKEDPTNNNLLLQYFFEGEVIHEEFDMAVLAVGLQPSKKRVDISKLMGLELTENGFLAVETGGQLASNVPGIYGIGGFIAPKTVPEIMIDVGAVTALINKDLRNALPQMRYTEKETTLIVGGGVAGLTAAVTLAEQGLPSIIIEQNNTLGGKLSDIPIKTEGFDYLEYLAGLMRKVNQEPLITVYLNSDIVGIKGALGDFASNITVREKGKSVGKIKNMQHGALILAVGGESEPVIPELIDHPHVVMGSHLEQRLAQEGDNINHLLFLQCGTTGSRLPFCKRTCCVQTVLSAIKIKEQYPHMTITVIYRNLRTFGLWEKVYIKARDMGVVFLQLEAGHDAVINLYPKLQIRAYDVNLRDTLTFYPDLLVVADGVRPRHKLKQFAEMLNVGVDHFGFIQEAHPKWNPIETANHGVFVCGSAVAPTLVSETILQAKAVGGLAAKMLIQGEFQKELPEIVKKKCSACMTCVPSVQLELI